MLEEASESKSRAEAERELMSRQVSKNSRKRTRVKAMEVKKANSSRVKEYRTRAEIDASPVSWRREQQIHVIPA
jgi:hypothetical protein